MAKLFTVIFFLALAITLVKSCSASTVEPEKRAEKATKAPKPLLHRKLSAISLPRNLEGTCTTNTCGIGVDCPEPCQCITESGLCYSDDCTQYDCGKTGACPSPCACLAGYGLCYIPETGDCTQSGCGLGIDCQSPCQCITEYGICTL